MLYDGILEDIIARTDRVRLWAPESPPWPRFSFMRASLTRMSFTNAFGMRRWYRVTFYIKIPVGVW
jgi:hypothetical protein